MHDNNDSALSLRHSKLTALPASLGQLTNLQQLDVTGNALATLPNDPGNLLQLKKLYLDDNALIALPPWFGSMSVSYTHLTLPTIYSV